MEGVSVNATKFTSSSKRESSAGNYKLSWSQQASWCSQAKIVMFKTPIRNITTFLTETFPKSLQYRTINSYSYAIPIYLYIINIIIHN